MLFGAGKLIVVNLELSAGRHTHSKNPDGLGERLWVVGGGLGLVGVNGCRQRKDWHDPTQVGHGLSF